MNKNTRQRNQANNLDLAKKVKKMMPSRIDKQEKKNQ